MTLHAALAGLAATMTLALATWVLSYLKRDVSIVDSVWSLMILLAGAVYAVMLDASGPAMIGLALAALWALRLTGYITWRNWGEDEDRRYQAIRARNQPNFALKSVCLVFALQAVMAWTVSLPLLATAAAPHAWGLLDSLGAAVVLFGVTFETVGDAQLAVFKAQPANRGRVMDSGLWRYTRHPNYFGEFCTWWGFYLLALAGGGSLSLLAVLSPLLMSVMLLKVSGVTLLEKDIGERRPAYRDYIAHTNAFFPGRPQP